ncbi:hypothetical protein N2W54_006601 [Lotmaria passim]
MQDLSALHGKVAAADEHSSELWVKRERATEEQRRLSSVSRKPVMTATDLYGVPTPGGICGSRMRSLFDSRHGLCSSKSLPRATEEGYVSLHAGRFGGGADGNGAVAATLPPGKGLDVDGQLADFVVSSLIPVSYIVTGYHEEKQQMKRHGSDEAEAQTVAAVSPPQPTCTSGRGASTTAATAVVAVTSRATACAAADDTNARATVPARFELTSAENGDVVERDALAGLDYWNAANPKTTQYVKPSALLEEKERRDCTLFRRYSRNYEKLVTDTARRTGGEAGAAIQASYETFKATCVAEERKPIYKRSFYAGESVDWKKKLLEQQAEIDYVTRRAVQ